jgi:23S rRNA (uracil1939-C5)-methyltransferase
MPDGRSGEVRTAEIIDTTIDGRGVARGEGKTVFVQGAIAGETVRFLRRRKRRNYDEAELVEVLKPSPERVEPGCEYFGVCGGCSLQHISRAEQVRLKESALLDNLQRIGNVKPAVVLPPILGAAWGYRRKARLAVKHVEKKGRVLVGFRERNKPYVTNMVRCDTLHPQIGERLDDLSQLIGGLSVRNRIPQIETAVGENGIVMIFRVLDPPSTEDISRLADFQNSANIRIFLQSGGPDTVVALNQETGSDTLQYRIFGGRISISFTATDFIQVHSEVNEKMITQALKLLGVEQESRVLDLFCGLGNFTLPLAHSAAEVVGVEASAEMVKRAGMNASQNGITNAVFFAADLTRPEDMTAFDWSGFDRVLLDPPRTGAAEILPLLERVGAEKILYVSCHPGTLARDARRLVEELGYDLAAAGVMDMFSQTSHVESMALFERR